MSWTMTRSGYSTTSCLREVTFSDRKEEDSGLKSAEEALGEFVLGYIGNPNELDDDEKWLLYDLLSERGNLLRSERRGQRAEECGGSTWRIRARLHRQSQ